MARTKQRENYGNGSVSAVKVSKKDRNGNVILDKDGNPMKVQEHNRKGQPVWRICVSVGTEEYVDKNGNLRKRQRKVQKRFAGTLKQARELAKNMVEEYQRVDFDSARDNFSSLIKKWNENDHRCSEKQQKQYLRHLGYIAPYLDSKCLIELKKQDVEDAIAGISRDRNLSVTTTNKVLSVVNRVFDFALDNDYLVRNPCRGISPQESQRVEQRRALSEGQAAMLRIELDKAEVEAYRQLEGKEARQGKNGNTFGRSEVRGLCTLSYIIAVRLMLATGVRRGEALGLIWDNVNLDEGTIRISQTLNESNIVKTPKTDAGIRNLYVDEHTLQHLRHWKDYQKKMLHLINVDGMALSQDNDTFVFITNRGTKCDPTNCYRWWAKFRERIGFEGWVLHELRHSQVTILKANGIDWTMIQERIGHSRPTTVTLTYLHEMPARDREAADVMGRVLYEAPVEDERLGKGVLRLSKTA